MSNVSSGARIVFKVNGAKVAYANALQYSIKHNHEAIQVIDQLDPVEYAENSYNVTFTVTMFRVPFRSSTELGLRPKFRDIITQPELNAEIVDTKTGATLAFLRRVKCVQEDFSVGARELAKMTLSFVAIEASDESGF